MTGARWFMIDELEVILLPVGVHLKATLGSMWPGHRIHLHLNSMTTLPAATGFPVNRSEFYDNCRNSRALIGYRLVDPQLL